jgi:Spy/CpxP family protein refolding chaperone
MKTQMLNKVTAAVFLAVMMIGTDAMAQRARTYERRSSRAVEQENERQQPANAFCRSLPGITKEQLGQIEVIRLNTMKKNQVLQNQLGEKRAQLRSLSTADRADGSAIDRTINEMAAIRAEMAKNRMASHQEIRKLLTDEQRIIFDNRRPGRREQGINGKRGKMRRGHGFRGDCPYYE